MDPGDWGDWEQVWQKWTHRKCVSENLLAGRRDARVRVLQGEGTAWTEAERLASPGHTNNSVHVADDTTQAP